MSLWDFSREDGVSEVFWCFEGPFVDESFLRWLLQLGELDGYEDGTAAEIARAVSRSRGADHDGPDIGSVVFSTKRAALVAVVMEQLVCEYEESGGSFQENDVGYTVLGMLAVALEARQKGRELYLNSCE